MDATSVTLEEVLAAASVRAASLVPETSGYLALAIADASARLPFRLDDPMVSLSSEGTVKVARGTFIVAPEECARRVRDVLSRLLALSTGSAPALAAAARPRKENPAGVESFVAELEAALVPVNRSAARRALARLARETVRAKEAGKLRRKRSARPPAPAAQPQPRAPEPRASAPAAKPSAPRAQEPSRPTRAQTAPAVVLHASEAPAELVIDVDFGPEAPAPAIVAQPEPQPVAAIALELDVEVEVEREPTPTAHCDAVYIEEPVAPAPVAPAPIAAAPAPIAPAPIESRVAYEPPIEETSIDAPVEPIAIAPVAIAPVAAASVVPDAPALSAAPVEPAPVVAAAPVEPAPVVAAAPAPVEPARVEPAPIEAAPAAPARPLVEPTVQRSNVDDLLDRFAVSPVAGPEHMTSTKAALKRLAGLEPTPPPPMVLTSPAFERAEATPPSRTPAPPRTARATRPNKPASTPSQRDAQPAAQRPRAMWVALVAVSLVVAGLLGHYLPTWLA
ncbi:MAG: hypothetical protein U0271_01675 [Polyangiaceae bacterium]